MKNPIIQTALFIVLFCFQTKGQQHDNIWFLGHEAYNGYSSKLNFNVNPILTDTFIRNLPMDRSSVSICDSLGNLLFLSNSIQVFNANYQLMQNGDSLNPGQVANDNRQFGYIIPEGSIIIPHPKQQKKYYLFHQSSSQATANLGFADKLYYTLIDMNANGGLGRVEKKNQLLYADSLCFGQLEAVKHGNGKDWWLVQAQGGTNGFYTFLIEKDTIRLTHKQYIGNNNRIAGYESTGQAVFSPNGNVYTRYDSENDLDIYDFDRCSGLFSNPLHIPIQDSADISFNLVGGGVAISSNNQYLYVSSLVDLYQFDLWATTISTSKTTVAHYDYFTSVFPTIFGFLQLAPDGKLYGYANGTRYLHIIDNPDTQGLGASVQQHDLFIHHPNGHFLPNFPHYRTPILTGSPCDTITNTVTIKKRSSTVKIYPNPASTTMTLESGKMIEKIRIYTAIGQEVFYQTKVKQLSLDIDTRSFENGTYFISIWVEGAILNQQFQVLR